MDGSTGSKAYNVVHGRMVLEGTPDFLARRSAIAARFTQPHCRKCDSEDFIHDSRCPNASSGFAASSPRAALETMVVRVVRQRMLMQSLRDALTDTGPIQAILSKGGAQ